MCLLRKSSLALATFLAVAIILMRPFEGSCPDTKRVIGQSTGKPATTMADLSGRLDKLRPTIEKLMKIGGTPGLSLGVMHKGKQIHYTGYGVRDAEKQLLMTEETVLPVCSLSKAVTAAAFALLVEEKKVTWDTLVKDVLPEFKSDDAILQECLTITDLFCHRSGMSWGDNLFLGTDNNFLISGEDTMRYINSQTRLLPFRGQFAYNNLPFDLSGKILESLTGSSFQDFVQKRIFDPLEMDRTFLKTPSSEVDNVGACYNALDDGTSAPVTCVKAGDDWFGVPSVGVRTCVRDLMKLYKAFLTSFNDQIWTGKTSTEGSPLKQVAHLMSAKIPIDQPSRNEATYGMGWGRVELPGKMGQIGYNSDLMPDGMPIVGKGVPSQLVMFHQGSLPGALALVVLLPDTDSAIVVSSNALALNDVADWVGQLVLEEFLDVPKEDRNDYISAAETSAAENLKWYPRLTQELNEARTNGTSPKTLNHYVGTYWDDHRFVKIVVVLQQDQLYWLIQGLESEKFPLTHYENDSFTWLVSRNELSRRGRWVGYDQDALFWKVNFKANKDGKIDRLSWVHDNGVPAVEYMRE